MLYITYYKICYMLHNILTIYITYIICILHIYVIWKKNKIVGFTLLNKNSDSEREIYLYTNLI